MSNQQPISTFLGIAAAAMLGTNAFAAIINVPGDQPTIQAGINIANPGDVVIVAQGEYFENINFNGKAITVRSTDPNDAGVVLNTIINGTGFFHVVQCVSGEGTDTVLSGFVITGGNANGAVFPDNAGGGMYNDSSSPTVTNCTFSGNSGTFSGGMYNQQSNPTVTNCSFSGNTATSGGGGMYNAFASNPTVTNCTFTGNTANVGGGMQNSGGSPTVTNCSFSGNSADVNGGGMANFSSSPTVTNCTFSGNSAGVNGGGMANRSNSRPTVTNCTFSGNTADVNGGGMANRQNSGPTVTNCTFSGNTATDGGGGMFSNFSTSSPTVTNCILWGDSPDEIAGGTPTVTFSDVQGGWPGTGNIDADPLFVDPDNGDYRLLPDSPCIDAADNTAFDDVGCGDCQEPNPDCLTGCSDSACEGIVCDIDPFCCDSDGCWDELCAAQAALVCDCAVLSDITTDLDGNPRFVDDPATDDTGNPGAPGPIVDMGAYEFQPCPWDLNGDGVVNVLDLVQLVMSFGPCEGCPADFDDDGFVNVLDLIALIINFGPCPGTPCVWDVNGDGVVDQSDVQAVTSNLGPCDGCPEDVNGDGVVNGQDVQAVATHFGPCP